MDLNNEVNLNIQPGPINPVLGMASVPIQKMSNIFDPQTALKKGTIFPELDLPFFAGGDEDVQ